MKDESKPEAEAPTSTAETSASPEVIAEEDIMQDIWAVGEDKPMGYLPVSTITEICGKDIDEVRAACLENGLKTNLLSEEECHVGGGALYAYDAESLQALLDEHRDILEKNAWPTSADDFALKVTNTFADNPDLSKLVAWAFADKRPEYQRP